MSVRSLTYQLSVLSAIIATNISQSFYLQDAGKKLTGIDMEQNYVTDILCISFCSRRCKLATCRFHISEEFDRLVDAFPARAWRLLSAERHVEIANHPAVYPHRADLQPTAPPGEPVNATSKQIAQCRNGKTVNTAWRIKNYYYYYIRLTASFPGQPGWAGTKKVKPGSLDLNEARDYKVLGRSGISAAGPYANNLHLAPDR